ncbi:hypothetical protein HAX54_049707 [Datura stramonium]|uniref:Uncharacterized protein n=1 Tax=Datura stramonium TaxID=4076 RepID=A0ABS8WN23_DATST|nr:hypothetical protein [Datura stramonium]
MENREEEEAIFHGDNQRNEPQKKSKPSRRDKSRGRDPSLVPISTRKAPRQRRAPDDRLLSKQTEEKVTEACLLPIGVMTKKATATDHHNSARTMRSGRRESITEMDVICAGTPLIFIETIQS